MPPISKSVINRMAVQIPLSQQPQLLARLFMSEVLEEALRLRREMERRASKRAESEMPGRPQASPSLPADTMPVQVDNAGVDGHAKTNVCIGE